MVYNPVEQLPWMDDALCAEVGAEAFFPDPGGTDRPARVICAACEVKEQCLEYAQANVLKYGIFGGLSPKQRKKLRQKKARRSGQM